MRIDVEIGASSNLEMLRAMLNELDDDGSASLPVLCRADLCALGLRSQKVSGLERLAGANVTRRSATSSLKTAFSR
jgi:hypothetical protein